MRMIEESRTPVPDDSLGRSGKRVFRHAGDRIVLDVATLVGDGVEERAPLRGRQRRRGVDRGLNQPVGIELGGQRGANARQRFPRVDFVDDRFFGLAPLGDVDRAADETEKLAIVAEPRLSGDDRPAEFPVRLHRAGTRSETDAVPRRFERPPRRRCPGRRRGSHPASRGRARSRPSAWSGRTTAGSETSMRRTRRSSRASPAPYPPSRGRAPRCHVWPARPASEA